MVPASGENWTDGPEGTAFPPGEEGSACLWARMVSMEANRVRAGLCWGTLFLALFGLCCLFPIIGDDWFREELGRNLTGPLDLLETLISGWQTYNGRVSGNLLAYVAGSRKLIRELFRALFLLGTIYFAGRNAGGRGLWSVLLAAAAVLVVPQGMFAQVYPWAAGFFNYVPPVALLLAAFWLLGAVFEKQPVSAGAGRVAAVFFLGFFSQFFIENYTVYAVWAGVVLLAGEWIGRRTVSPATASFCMGTALGALLLFLSPSYGLIWSSGGAYETGLGQGLSGLWETLEENQAVVLEFLITGCPVLFLGLTALGAVWFARSRRRVADWALLVVLLLGCLRFAMDYWGEGPTEDLAVVVLWGLALGAGCWRWLPRGTQRNRALFFWAGAAVSATPLLVVSPVGARCLYLSYVCLLVTAGNLLSALELDRLPIWVRRGLPLVVCVGVLAFYVRLFWPIHALEGERIAAMEQAVAQRVSQVVLPAYPNPDYLWEGDTFKITSRYYVETPGDIQVLYDPAPSGETGG